MLFLIITATHNSYSQTESLQAYAVFSDSARANDFLQGNFILSEIDTLQTSQIEIKIGNTEQHDDCLNQVIDFDPAGTLPIGFSYTRVKDKINIGVTSSHPAWTYFCEVRLKDHAGNWGQPFAFICN